MDPLSLFLAVLKAATLSVGGLSSLPVLRQELVSNGSLTEKQVIEALTIGRLSPGPTGLYIVSLGYLALGWLGAALALVAASLPPLSMVVLASLVRRWLLSPVAAGIVRGVALSTSGLTLATGVMLLSPDLRLFSLPVWQLGLAVVSIALSLQGKLHPGLIVGGGAIVGFVLGRG